MISRREIALILLPFIAIVALSGCFQTLRDMGLIEQPWVQQGWDESNKASITIRNLGDPDGKLAAGLAKLRKAKRAACGPRNAEGERICDSNFPAIRLAVKELRKLNNPPMFTLFR